MSAKGCCAQSSPLMPKGELKGVWTWYFALHSVARPLWIPAFAGMTDVVHKSQRGGVDGHGGDFTRFRRELESAY